MVLARIVLLALVLVGSRAEAKMMIHHDLAGLLLQADAVVIADRVGTRASMHGPLTQYRIVKALRGTRRPGELVEVYDKHFDTDGHTLDARAVLFLTTSDGMPALVTSGLRVIEQGKVWRFEQHNNPGPFVMVPQGSDPQDQWGLGGSQLDLAGLERAIADAQRRIDTVTNARTLRDPAKRRAAVVGVFTEGIGAGGFYVDVLAERARALLVEAGDLEGALLVEQRDRGMTFRSSDFAKLAELVAYAQDPKHAPALRATALAVVGRGTAMLDQPRELAQIADLIDDPAPEVRASAIVTAAQPAQVITSVPAQQRALAAHAAKVKGMIARRYATEQDPRVLAAVLYAYEVSFRTAPPTRAAGPRLVAVPTLARGYLGVDTYCVRPAKVTSAKLVLRGSAGPVSPGNANIHVHCAGSVSTGGGTGRPPAGSYDLAVELVVQGAATVTLPLGRLIVEPTGELRLSN